MSVDSYVSEINKTDNINLHKIISKFEKKLLKCFRLYEDNVGFEDYKMNEYDYIVLYTIWSFIKGFSIEEYLIIMYSYYKIEDFYFPNDMFKSNNCINMLTNTAVIKILDMLIKI